MSILRFFSHCGGAPACGLHGLLLLIGALTAGCYSVTNHDLSSGFVLRTSVPSVSLEAGGGREELYYRGSNGKHRCVWKYVTFGAAYAGNGTVAFSGLREESDALVTREYFAAKENGPPVVITEAILVWFARKQNAQPEGYITTYEGLKPNGDKVQFEFAGQGVNQPNLLVDLTWDDVSGLVDSVMRTGRPHKDKLSGLTYWE
jgi:hypothetical protein